MRKRRILVGVGILSIFLNVPSSAQFKTQGFLAFQFEKGESESDFPHGTFRGTQAGLQVTSQTKNIFLANLEIRLKSENQAGIEEAWVACQPSPSFGLKLGLYLVPFGKYNRSNRPYETPFIQPPLLIEALYPASWRDIGLLIEGKIGILNYFAYLGNGLAESPDLASSQQFKDNNSNKATGGRVSLFLSQSLEVGASYYRGKYDDANSRFLILQGGDVSWSNDFFLFTYEYGKALANNPGEYPQGETEGHWFLLSLTVGAFSPAVSYQKIKVNDPYHGPGFSPGVSAGSGLSSDVSRWAFGVTSTPAPGLFIKLEYDLNRETGGQLKNDAIQAQVAFRF